MSILSRLQAQTQEVDTAKEMADYNGSGFIKDSGFYKETIKKAFVGESEGGAVFIYVQFEGEGMHEDTMYISNKEGQLFYERNGKQFPMPSYVDVKKINYLLTGEMITTPTQIKTEERIIKHYKWIEDPENDGKKIKSEIELTAEVLVDWIGKEITIGIQMAEKEASKKVGDKYVKQGVRAENKDGEPYLEVTIINYYGSDDNKTASEKLGEKESAQYAKDEIRIEKSPVKMFKAKKPKSGTNAKGSTSSASNAPKKPNVF